jgi:AraC-like DNA-binding protein
MIYLARTIGGKVENASSPHIGISRTIEYLHKHFTEKVSIEKLAKNTGMSMSSLSN